MVRCFSSNLRSGSVRSLGYRVVPGFFLLFYRVSSGWMESERKRRFKLEPPFRPGGRRMILKKTKKKGLREWHHGSSGMWNGINNSTKTIERINISDYSRRCTGSVIREMRRSLFSSSSSSATKVHEWKKRNSRKKITFELKIQIIHAPAPDRSFGKRCRCVQHFIGFNETGDSGILLFLKTQRTVSTAKKKSTKRKKKNWDGRNKWRPRHENGRRRWWNFFFFIWRHTRKQNTAGQEWNEASELCISWIIPIVFSMSCRADCYAPPDTVHSNGCTSDWPTMPATAQSERNRQKKQKKNKKTKKKPLQPDNSPIMATRVKSVRR